MRVAVKLAASVLVAACGSSSSPTSPDLAVMSGDMAAAGDLAVAGDLGKSGDLAVAGDLAAGTGPDLMTLATINGSGTVVEVGSTTPVVGATICVYQHPELACATSSATGTFTVAVPQGSYTGWLVDKAGYAGTLAPMRTLNTSFSGWVVSLPKSADTQTFYTAAGATYPSATAGFVRVLVNSGSNGDAGSTATLVPSSGTGPYFAATNGTYAAMSSTSTAGLVRFAGLAPTGSLEVDAQCGTGLTQLTYFGWVDASNQAHATFPVVAGYETLVQFGCF